METSCFHIKTHPFSPSLSIPKTKNSSISIWSQPIHLQHISLPPGDRSSRLRRLSNRPSLTGIECAKGSPVGELEIELESEIDLEEEEWKGIEWRWRDKCKEKSGIVELMECLEREAIMGEDEGREPADYSRRAQIFDKSSRVFQALKANDTPSSHSP